MILAHELLRNECKPSEWRDEFANEALHILAQHAVQVSSHFYDFLLSKCLFVHKSHNASFARLLACSTPRYWIIE